MKTAIFFLAILAAAGILVACGRSDPENKPPATDRGFGAAAEPGENSDFWGPHVTDLAFLPDGKQLVAVYQDIGIVLWDLKSRKPVHVMENSHNCRKLAITANGKWVLAGRLCIWDLGTGKKISTMKTEQNSVDAFALSFDKKYALVGGNGLSIPPPNQPKENLQLYDTNTGKIIHHLFGHESTVGSVAISNDGNFGLSESGTGTLKLWDLQKGKLLRNYELKEGGLVSFSADDKWAYSLGKSVRIWDVETGILIQSYDNLGKKSWPMAFSTDKRLYITREERSDESLTLWELLTGKILKELDRKKDKRFINKAAFSPEGKKIALCGNHQLLQIQDLETGKIIFDLVLPNGKNKGVRFIY